MCRSLSIIVSVLLPATVSAQLLQPVYSAPSPQAASLGEYGEVPVSHFTGTPDVSVPLFEIEAGDYKYPVGLSYHLASVKPNAQPGSVGMGWLLTDACICRTVRGVYDEKMDEHGNAHGYYGHHAKMQNITGLQFRTYTQNNLTGNGWFEVSADEFSFSMNGHSGLFYLNPDGGWTVVSDEDIIVEFEASTGFLDYHDLADRIPKIENWANRGENARWFKGFTLVTPDGVRYEFGGVDAIDFSVPYYGRGSGDLVATAWHLTKITTPEGRVISFDYSTDQLLCDLHYSSGRTVSYGFGATSSSYLNRDIHGRSGLSGFLVYPASLTRIVGPADTLKVDYSPDKHYNEAYLDGYLDALYWEDSNIRSENFFHYSAASPQVEFFEMIPINDTGTMRGNQQALANCFRHDLVQRVTLSHRYGGTGRSWYFKYGGVGRRKLMDLYCREGIPEPVWDEYIIHGYMVLVPRIPEDTSSTSLPRWHFRYDVERIMPKGYILPATDAWGTWKGGTVSLSGSYSSRPSTPAPLSYAKAETLKEVYYPTGGKTVFEYEQNDYGKLAKADHSGVETPSMNGMTGGLRVKSVTRMDRSGNIHGVTRYHYRNMVGSNTSSGIAQALPPSNIVYYVNEDKYMVVESSEGFPAVSTNRNTPTVGYSSVIEEILDGNSNTLGYIRYRYSNFDEDQFGTSHRDSTFIYEYNSGGAVVGVPYTSNSGERGKLQSKEYYDSGQNLLRKETIRYARVCNGALTMADQRVATLCPDPAYHVSAHLGWLTQTLTYSYLPVERVLTDYLGGMVVTQTSSTSYNTLKLPSFTTDSRSDGSLLQQEYAYVSDSLSRYNWMVSQHIVNAPLYVRTGANGEFRMEAVSYTPVTNPLGKQTPYVNRMLRYRAGSDDPKIAGEVDSVDSWGNPIGIAVDGLHSQLVWSLDGQRLTRVTDNYTSTTRGGRPGNAKGISRPPQNIDLDLDGPAGSMTRYYGYDASLRPDFISVPNGLVSRYTYDALDRLEGVWESDAVDAWSSDRLVEGHRYEFAQAHAPYVFERYSQEAQIPSYPYEPEAMEAVREVFLDSSLVFSMLMEYRTAGYHELHPTDRFLMYLPDSLSICFRGTGFSYYHDFGDSLATAGTAAMLLDLYGTGVLGDSLVCHIPLELDFSTLTISVPSGFPTGGNGGALITLPPGQYKMLFLGFDANVGFEFDEGGRSYPSRADSRLEGSRTDPEDEEDPDEPGLEGVQNFPSFSLVMECLPLIEEEPEEEPEVPQFGSWNSVRNWSSRDGTEGNTSRTMDWYDDFGRKEVSVASGASPDGKDLATLLERDGWGREVRGWLPVVSEDSLTIVHPGADSVKTIAGMTYGTTEKPYSLTEYEQSSLSRVTGQYGPGSDWHNAGKKVATAYLTNAASGAELSCRRFVCTSSNDGTSWTVTSPGNYAAGRLYVTRTTDEDGRQVWEFKDFDGNIVLSRAKLAANQYLETYYVYDGFGNLQAVLPPLASASISGGSIPQDVLSKYAYLYTYDDRDRCIVKKLPGAEPVYYVYDEADRAILTQDGNSRNRGETLFTMYDVFGRVALTGTCRNTITPGDRLRTYVKATYAGASGALKGYDIEGLTLLNPEVLTTSWYDTHSFVDDVLGLTLSGSDTTLVYGTPTPVSYGLQTGLWAALLGDRMAGEPDGTWTIIRYDRRNRVAKTLSSTHKGGRMMEDAEYTFRGSPSRRHIVHTDSLGYSFAEDYAYTYDHEERLLGEKHSLNGADSVVVVSNAYDSLGRLSSNGRAGNPQLTTQYSYNIRSWTTGISSPYFTETLYYNTVRPGASSSVQWGGNISSMVWEGSKAYDFTYDGLSRLTSAAYVGDISKSRQYSYDAHGNITGVTEGSTPHAYTYTGNHLAGTQYDSNGNTTSDSVTGIVSARYNVLNLPEEIIKSNGDTVRYVYGAGGTKLRERVIPPSPSGSVTKTDYVGNLVYRDDQLGRILVDGGSIVAKDSTLAPAYEFAFTDYLGSIRSLVTVGDSLFRKTEYGPYGEVLSENWTSLSASPGGGSGGNGGNGAGGEIEVEDEEEDDGGGGSRGPRSVSVIQTRLDNPYRYGGKERLDVSRLDLYDFGARQYAPALPRWLTMDPLADKYYRFSPYAYCFGNPIRYYDPDGSDGWDTILGYIIGGITNVVPSSSGLRDIYRPHDSTDYNSALKHSDRVAASIGESMVAGGEWISKVGAGMTGAGLGMMGTGTVIAVSVVGAPEGGVVIIGGADVFAAGVTVSEAGVATAVGGMGLMMNAGNNSSGGYERGKTGNGTGDSNNSIINDIKRDIGKGKAPDSIEHAHNPRIPHEKHHVHFKDGSALNIDGTWKHKSKNGRNHKLTNKEIEYLQSYDWTIPE